MKNHIAVHSQEENLDYLEEEDEQKEHPKANRKKLLIIISSILAAIVVIVTVVVVSVVLTDKNKNDKLTPEAPNSDTPTFVAVPPLNSECYLDLKIDPNYDSLQQSNYKFYNGQVIKEEDLTGFTRYGYELEGWYTSKELTERVPFPLVFEKEATFFAKWKQVKSSVEIKFRPLGGVGYLEPIVGKLGDKIESIPNPYRRMGYNFEGWCILDSDTKCSRKIVFPYELSYNLTIAPKWVKLNSVDGSIKFDGNNGKGETDPLKCSKSQPVYEMSHTFEPPSEEYYFDGFAAKKQASSPSTSRIILEEERVQFPYNFEGDVTFVAQWAKYSYGTIAVHMNDGNTPDSKQKFVIGKEIESISPISRENYQFGGWFTSPEFTTQISFPYKVVGDLDIYAKWVEHKADGSIKFDANGGSGEKSPELFTYNSTINFIENPFKHDGYDFKGWYTSPDCKPETKVNFPYQFAGTVTFYASWQMNIPYGMYLISYDMNGGQGLVPTQLTAANTLARLNIPSQFKTSDGKGFIGWTLYPKSDYAQIFSFLEDMWVSDSFADKNRIIKLYAVWSSDYYTITYDLNGGTGEVYPTYVDKKKHQSQQSIRIPSFTIEKGEAKLEGWGFTKEYSNYFNNNFIIPAGTIKDDTTLYAIFYTPKQSQDIPANSKKYKGKTLWLKGMSKIDDSRWESFSSTHKDLVAVTYDNTTDNWFDVKKVDPNGVDSDMCWAAVASNVLHWFFKGNEDYVEKYFKLYPNDPRPDTHFYSQTDSGIYQYFRQHYNNYGGLTKAGIEYYINGLSSREGGGFLKRVFQNYTLSNLTETLITRNLFNTFITESLEKGLYVSWALTLRSAHAVTLYGADYDDDGWIRTLYMVDSNNIIYKTLGSQKPIAIEKYPVKYFDEGVLELQLEDPESYNNKYPLVWVQDHYDRNWYYKVIELQSNSLLRDIWEDFFKKHPVPEN